VTRASLLAAAVLAAAPVLTSGASAASADVIRVGGSARIRVGGGIRVRTPRVYWRPRSYYSPRRVYVGGAIWVGGGYYDYRYAAPPPPPPPCDCGDTVTYYPAAPAPAPAVVVATPPRPRLARLGLGAFLGGSEVDDTREGDDFGLLARFRLTRGLILEGELSGTDLGDDSTEGRVGGALVYEFGAGNRWAPYVLGGVGVTQVEHDVPGENERDIARSYGEVGVGLRWAVTPRFHLAADIRGGATAEIDEHRHDRYDDDATARAISVPGDDYDDDEALGYTRGRLSAMLYF
jgi:opacity protein-like surface antigen